jgi:hypothetical protein
MISQPDVRIYGKYAWAAGEFFGRSVFENPRLYANLLFFHIRLQVFPAGPLIPGQRPVLN